MRIISKKALRDFWILHPEAESPLQNWFEVVSGAAFGSFHDIRKTLPSADWVQGLVVFNVGGNNYRLVAAVHFNTQRVYVRQVLTHAEYSKKGRELV